MNTVAEEITNHPADLLMESIAGCRRSLDKFNEVLESILDDIEAGEDLAPHIANTIRKAGEKSK